jgi:nitrogen regulatory protein PII
MQLVTGIIKPHRLEAVSDALKEIGVNGLTVIEVQGYGRQRGRTETYRGSEYQVNFLPKIMVQVACDDDDANQIADAIASSAKTGTIGDGKVWIADLQRVIRVRTGESDDAAL